MCLKGYGSGLNLSGRLNDRVCGKACGVHREVNACSSLFTPSSFTTATAALGRSFLHSSLPPDMIVTSPLQNGSSYTLGEGLLFSAV